MMAKRSSGVFFEQAVAVLLDQIVRERLDVVALIPRSVELDRVLAADLLNIAALDRVRELVYLIARVVDVELTGHVVAGPVEHGGRQSPRTPPRALPMCIGPVGLAETNSTMTFSGFAALVRP